jgi:hypothetical protein
MSENTMNKEVKNEEIDLLELLRRMGQTIGRWSHYIGRAFLISIVFLLKRWLPICLSLIAGVGASYLVKERSYPFYTSDMVLRNNILSNADMISFVNRLKAYSLEGNTSALVEALSISPDQANGIIEISAHWIIDQSKDGSADYVDISDRHDVYDTINVRMQDRFDIRAKIISPNDLTSLRKGIINFIQSDSLFQQRNRVRLTLNRDMLSRLKFDILQLDSLQKIKYFEETKNRFPQNGGQVIFLQEQKTQLIYTDIYTLYGRKQILEAERDLYKGTVTVLSEFSKPIKRSNGTFYYGMKVIPLFLGLTLLILIVISNRKKLLEIYRRY